jgi:toxin FitB
MHKCCLGSTTNSLRPHLVCEAKQVLPMDAEVARAWAKLMHKRSDTLTEDALIAATALTHQLTVVTRNVRDFSALNVACLDPFAGVTP